MTFFSQGCDTIHRYLCTSFFYVDSYAEKRNDTVVDSLIQAVILSAGFATRMYPLTLQTGKSLLPLGNRFVIDFQVDALMRMPIIEHVFVVTNEKFYPPMKGWHDASPHKKCITLVSNGVIDVEEQRGAFGDLQLFLDTTGIKNSILVLGNDNIFEDPLEGIIQCMCKRDSIVVAVNDFVKTNCVSQTNEAVIDEGTFQMREFRSKVVKAISSYYASFLYAFPLSQLHIIRDYLEDQSYANEPAKHFIEWALDHNHPLCGFPMQGRRFDTGNPASYKNTQEWHRDNVGL